MAKNCQKLCQRPLSEGRQVRGRAEAAWVCLQNRSLLITQVCCHQAGARESSKCAVLLPAAKGEAEAGGAFMLQQYLARDRASKHLKK